MIDIESLVFVDSIISDKINILPHLIIQIKMFVTVAVVSKNLCRPILITKHDESAR